MEGSSLPAACSVAFTAVFVVLALLALVIRLVTLAFPERPTGDAATFAAIAAAVASRRGGARVVRIEEVT